MGTMTVATEVLDLATLDQLRGLQEEGEEDLLVELIDLFVADVPARVAGLADALERGDWCLLAERAHSLKGSCASLGAVHMARLCARLEAMGEATEERPTARAVFAELDIHYRIVCDALRRERGAAPA